MRDYIVPAPNARALVAGERRRAILSGVVVVGLAVLAAVLIRDAMLTLDEAQREVVAARAETDAAKADADAARQATGVVAGELNEARAALADGTAALSGTRNQLMQTTNALNAVTTDLQRVRQRLAATEAERDQARVQSARLIASLDVARAEVAGLQGDLAGAELRALAGRGLVALANLRIGDMRADLAWTDTRLSDAVTLATALDEHIGLSAAFEKHLHPAAPEDAKALAGTSARLGRLLSRILDLQKQVTRFSSVNKSGVGFNSPGFAGYILGRTMRGKTLESLPPTDAPKLGDIIRYQNGLAMFLLQDAEGQPFVIGMTPVGIAAFEPDFGVPRIGALATGIVAQ